MYVERHQVVRDERYRYNSVVSVQTTQSQDMNLVNVSLIVPIYLKYSDPVFPALPLNAGVSIENIMLQLQINSSSVATRSEIQTVYKAIFSPGSKTLMQKVSSNW